MHNEVSAGMMLLIAAIAALALANSPLKDAFARMWETHLIIGLSDFHYDMSIHHWINDGLMAVFFFVIGLEIKRALVLGELASVRRAALPIAAALGGMVVPATIYLILNPSGEAARGWGVPMATDIAFSLGVLALLGSRAPLSLKVFLTAFAVVDDIGAIMVIAIFFTDTINWMSLAVGVGMLLFIVALNSIGVRNTLVYALLSVVIWVSFFESGIHATVSGVLIAMTIPMTVRMNSADFVARGRRLLVIFERDAPEALRRGDFALTTVQQRGALQELEEASKEVESPLQRLEHLLHPWVAFVIMPVFAFANAGVTLDGDIGTAFSSPLTIGIILGLLIGKPLGIVLFAWIAVKAGLAALPHYVSWVQITGVGLLGGIGFTMAIFISSLAFSDAGLVTQSKLAIFVASIMTGILGYVFLRFTRQIESRLE
ncbi:MAG: Na+/H+ antiporter NhaA [Chloroflexota bacterium]|nr:Na+/H+ antiporter NhaA [Chloroflexota bacterium]MDE2688287.1 Na+/H+ antiporter NhaA [Chloroflexota bacterium]